MVVQIRPKQTDDNNWLILDCKSGFRTRSHSYKYHSLAYRFKNRKLWNSKLKKVSQSISKCIFFHKKSRFILLVSKSTICTRFNIINVHFSFTEIT